jgi:DNA-binding beta-propeller fold protein YncE
MRRIQLGFVIATSSALLIMTTVSRHSSAQPPELELQEVASTAYMPKGAELSPDGKTFYVINFGALDARNVTLYDAKTLASKGQIDLPGVAVEAVFNPVDSNTLYISNFNRDSVQVVDVTTRQVKQEIKLQEYSRPKTMAISRDGKTLFTANWAMYTVSQIDLTTGTVVRTLQAGKNPRGIALRKNGMLYVANFSESSIDVFGGGDYHKIKTIPVCKIPRHLALSPDHNTLYISCYRNWELHAMDLDTEQVTHKVTIGHSPKTIAVSRSGRYVWSADYGVTSTVSVVDTTDWTAQIFPVPAMDRGSGIAVTQDEEHALITGWYDSHVYLVGFKGTGGHPAESLEKVKEWIGWGHHYDESP